MNASAHIPDWMLEYHRLAPHIAAALEHGGGTHTVRDVAQGIDEKQFQFWPGEDSVIVTEIVDHPQKRVLNYFLAGGNLTELERMVNPIEEWAKEQGCVAIGLAGRKGWSKTFMRDMGYEPMWFIMGKEL